MTIKLVNLYIQEGNMCRKVLIVDDDYSFICNLVNSQPDCGMSFSIADSLNRANDMLNRDNFDLIIANSKIPGGSSLSLKNKIPSDTEILFLSSLDSEYNKIKDSGEKCYHKYNLGNRFEVLFSNV